MKLFLAALIIVATSLAEAQTPSKYQVTLTVFGDPPAVADELRSYYARELRSLGDVEVVDEGAFRIVVALVQIKNSGGAAVGWAGTDIYLSHPNLYTSGMGTLDPMPSQELVNFASKTWEYNTARIYAFGRNELRQHAQEAIADFDTVMLEPTRKLYRQMNQNMENSRKKP